MYSLVQRVMGDDSADIIKGFIFIGLLLNLLSMLFFVFLLLCMIVFVPRYIDNNAALCCLFGFLCCFLSTWIWLAISGLIRACFIFFKDASELSHNNRANII